jgi:superfamily II DNA/RNA helicase
LASSTGIQVVLVSATMSPKIEAMAKDLLDDPVRIVVESSQDLSLDEIVQYKVEFDRPEHKFDALCELHENLVTSQAVVFCNTKSGCKEVKTKLTKAGFSCSEVHADLSPDDRASVTSKFRSGAIRVLVATDVWGRGLDVQRVALVVNYDMPAKPEQYIHRVGRSGRFGRKGIAVSFVVKDAEDDEACLSRLEASFGAKIAPLPKDVRKVLEHFKR